MITVKFNTPLPAWLKPGQVMTPADHERLSKVSANWVKLFDNHRELDEVDCLRLICLELAGKKRPDIISRLKFWYNSRRHDREIIDIWNVK